VCLASQENEVDVDLDVITGSGDVDYYTGDYFVYNISLTNSGNNTIDTIFKVEVLNSTGGVFGSVRDYPILLYPNETDFLFPNITRPGREGEYRVYYFDTPGTYSVILSSETALTYYRYFDRGAYSFDFNEVKFTFDVMPSYERAQNERWNEFLDKNELYMDQVQQYIIESRNQSKRTRDLSFYALVIALFSIGLSSSNIYFSWLKLGDDKRKKTEWVWKLITGISVLFAIFVIYAIFLTLGWI
jgi:hypothetical protein